MIQSMRFNVEELTYLEKTAYGTTIEVKVDSFDEVLNKIPIDEAIKHYEPENLLSEIDQDIIKEYARKYLELVEVGAE
jgi:hypothetical protein